MRFQNIASLLFLLPLLASAVPAPAALSPHPDYEYRKRCKTAGNPSGLAVCEKGSYITAKCDCCVSDDRDECSEPEDWDD